jgi:hypothetical protein
MRYILTAVLAACLTTGAVATVIQPALPAVRHIAIDHSSVPMPTFDYGSGAAVESPTMAPDAADNHACDGCSKVDKSQCTMRCAHPGVLQVPVMQLPL